MSQKKDSVKKDEISIFAIAAKKCAEIVGHPGTFLVVMCLLTIWLVSGPFVNYSDNWQLIVNSSTSIFTILIVILVQNTQNRDSKSIHLKLDELIRVHKSARNTLIDLEKLSDEQLKSLEGRFKEICKE